MLLGFNLLLWTTHVTEEHFPLFAELKRAGYDGVEIPVFEGDPAHFARVGRIVRDEGLRCTAVTVLPDEAHSAVSADPVSRRGAMKRLHWAVDCLHAAGGEVLSGPFHQPLGVFTGEPPTDQERERLAEVHVMVADYAAGTGVRLSIEPLNRFECYVLNTVADARDLVARVDRTGYGLLYDTFHANIEEKDPVGVIAPNLDAINHVHLSENDRGTPGKGHVPSCDAARVQARGLRGLVRDRGVRAGAAGLARRRRGCGGDFFPSREEVYRSGHDFLRETWERAG
jgi:D-psicose/D-tagatose/L-ribulose 3-epimerase